MRNDFLKGDLFLTDAVVEFLPMEVIDAIWKAARTMKTSFVDPKQRFELYAGDGEQIIRHIQQTPHYDNRITVKTDSPVSDTVYLTTDGSSSWMMFSDEYGDGEDE